MNMQAKLGLVALSTPIIFFALAVDRADAQEKHFDQTPGKWSYSKIADPIAATSSDAFTLWGSWVGAKPAFRYSNEVPYMLLVCQEKSWYLTALVTGDKGPSLDPGHWEIDNRIDDIQGKFIPLYEVKGTQSHVNISKRDSLQILHSRKILIRLKLFNSAPLVVQFDMPPDALSIHERCGL